MHSVFVDLFPLILCAIFWIAMSCLSFSLLRSKKRFHSMQTSGEAARIRQTDVFRRSTVVLLVLGAAGGFLPSIFMMLLTGKVWSVNHQAPHSMVDVYLIMHIPLAIAWSLLVALQLWSADCTPIFTGITPIFIIPPKTSHKFANILLFLKHSQNKLLSKYL